MSKKKKKKAIEACKALVWSYEWGELMRCGSVDWNDVDYACRCATEALGKKTVRKMRKSIKQHMKSEE